MCKFSCKSCGSDLLIGKHTLEAEPERFSFTERTVTTECPLCGDDAEASVRAVNLFLNKVS